MKFKQGKVQKWRAKEGLSEELTLSLESQGLASLQEDWARGGETVILRLDETSWLK